jgi:glutathionylspermidine synthase
MIDETTRKNEKKNLFQESHKIHVMSNENMSGRKKDFSNQKFIMQSHHHLPSLQSAY